MDNIEITVFEEIKDYKEKNYFFNFRQWAFAILIAGLVIPTYILLKDKIGEEITSYIVIAIAGILGFIGFVKIHELPAEKILPYWFRHYFLFAKPIHYMSDEEYRKLHEKKKRKINKKDSIKKIDKKEDKVLKKRKRQEKLLMKAKKKYGIIENVETIRKDEIEENEQENKQENNELAQKISKLTKEEQEVLLKLLGR